MSQSGSVSELEQVSETTTAEANGTADAVPIALPPELPTFSGDVAATSAERPQIYPEVDEATCDLDEAGNPILSTGVREFLTFQIKCSGNVSEQFPNGTALTVAEAKFLLGWEDEADCYARLKAEDAVRVVKGLPPKIPAGVGSVTYLEKRPNGQKIDHSMMVDMNKKRVKCLHNHTNRPFDKRWAERLAQDILNRYWFFNGESIIVGKHGDILSGQHRLIGLVFAWQMWSSEKLCKKRWRDNWPTEPTLDCLLVMGIDEDDKVVRTLDNVKPRSLSDVVYTSPLFAAYDMEERKVLSKILAPAVDILWDRARGR